MTDNRGVRRPGPVLVYTSSRLLVFVVVAGVLALLGMRGILLLAAALVLSGLASYVLLSGQRDAMASSLAARTTRMRQRMDEAAAAEDHDDPSEADDPVPAHDPAPAADRDPAEAAGSAAERQPDGEGDGVDELGAAGVAQHRDQRAADGPVDDATRRGDGER